MKIAFCKMFLFKTRPISCKHWVAVASSPRGAGGAQVTSHLRRQQKQLKGTFPLNIIFFVSVKSFWFEMAQGEFSRILGSGYTPGGVP